MIIEEVPGHKIDVRVLNDIVHVLRCQCGWGPHPTHVGDVDDTKQLHWAAKICEREALDDFEAEVRAAVQSLEDPAWFFRMVSGDS